MIEDQFRSEDIQELETYGSIAYRWRSTSEEVERMKNSYVMTVLLHSNFGQDTVFEEMNRALFGQDFDLEGLECLTQIERPEKMDEGNRQRYIEAIEAAIQTHKEKLSF